MGGERTSNSLLDECVSPVPTRELSKVGGVLVVHRLRLLGAANLIFRSRLLSVLPLLEKLSRGLLPQFRGVCRGVLSTPPQKRL